jgi:hypothetical protein
LLKVLEQKYINQLKGKSPQAVKADFDVPDDDYIGPPPDAAAPKPMTEAERITLQNAFVFE